jgi:hypothetical protein
MRPLLILLGLVACGSVQQTVPDAAPPIDAALPASDAASDAATDAAAALDCTTYCTTVASACTGTNAQFGGASAADATMHCMGTCVSFANSATQTGDTLGCHLYHAMNAAMSGGAAIHCPHAGPAGDVIGTGSTAGGVCGDACTNFCTLVQTVCTGANAAYASNNDCMTACSGFSTAAKYTIDTSSFPSTTPTGNTLACRLYHATNAAVSAAQATTHCSHTKVVSAVCQ